MNLSDPKTLKAFLGKHGIRAEKGLGQHFLCSEDALDSILGRLNGIQGVLEIGPGPGVLTSPISERIPTTALELDARMVEVLGFSAPRAKVVQGDALTQDLGLLLSELESPRAIVSNLPYYITGPLLTRISEVRNQINKAILMMQKEVAQRVIAPAGNSDRGSLSVFLQYCFEINLVRQVLAGCFLPPPKVDSTILEFLPKKQVILDEEQERFYRTIRLGFAQPRKTLANNLVAGLHVGREQAVGWIEAVSAKPMARPQDLTGEQWVQLSSLAKFDSIPNSLHNKR